MLRPLPSKARLDELLHFNPDTGEIRWKVYKGGRAKAGDIAGTIDTRRKDGMKYRRIKIDGIIYKAHRLMYYYYTGEQPPEIDHKNGNSLDNRKNNLRPSDRNHNTKNHKMQKNNTSGVIGVRYCKTYKHWVAHLGNRQFQRLNSTLKTFKTFEAAVAQRKAWELMYGMAELKKHRKKV